MALPNPRIVYEDGPASATWRLILAHGAGSGASSPFLNIISDMLAERAIAVTRIEFSYMAAREDGKRRPPPRAERLIPEYEQILAEVAAKTKPPTRLLIGGKSMGGRVASMIANDAHRAGTIAGLVCLGYPFHPPGKPDDLRTAHFDKFKCPTLVVQGTRDPFGNKSEAATLALPKSMRVHWAEDGDHDLGPRGSSGFTRKGNLIAAADEIAAFAASLGKPR